MALVPGLPTQAFAAFGFLSDVCARWGSKSERLAFESVLRAQMVHYSAAQCEGLEILQPRDHRADELAEQLAEAQAVRQ